MKNKLILYALAIGIGLIFIGPMIFTFISSLKENTEIFSAPFSLPATLRFENYITAWTEAKMGRYLLNSIFISLSTVIIVIVVSSMVSFVLARFNFKFNKFLSIFFLLGMMIPMHTVLVPVAFFIGTFSLKNNVMALILLYVAFSLPFSILVLTRFMKGINVSLEEAAIMDGASYFQVYYKIILPMTVPAISTISIFNFLLAWNDILFPLLFINDDRLKPVALGLLNFSGERGSEYGPLMAAIAITISVPLIIYLLFQEKVEGGLASGAIKE